MDWCTSDSQRSYTKWYSPVLELLPEAQVWTGGQHLKGMKKASALHADWKSFWEYYCKVTRSKINQDDSEEVNAVSHLTFYQQHILNISQDIQSLIDKFNLDIQKWEKTAVYIHDLTEFMETILQTQEKQFYVGYEWIQLCMFTMLGIYTVNHLSALLSLQFKHLQFSIQKDPCGGSLVLLAAIWSEHTKQFLGSSQLYVAIHVYKPDCVKCWLSRNNFPLPEIIDDPSLIFSPHVFLFDTLFWLNAFEAPSLTSMKWLRELLIEGGRQQMPLPLKLEIKEYYLFCKTEMVDGDVILQWNQPMNESTLSRWLNSLGLIHGWLHSMFAHWFCYGREKMLNESGWFSINMLQMFKLILILVCDRSHEWSSTKFDYEACWYPHVLGPLSSTQYWHRYAKYYVGCEPNTTLMHAITCMSQWIDKRHLWHLSDKQRASIHQHLDYLEAIQQWDKQARVVKNNPTSQMQSQLDKLSRAVTNTFNWMSWVLRETTWKEFDCKQAVIDIEWQLSGATVNDEEAKEVLQNEDQMLPDQIHLLEKLLTWPTSCSLEAEWQHWNVAVTAVIKYCSIHEGGPLQEQPKWKAATEGFDNEQPATRRYNADGHCMLDLFPPQDNMLQKAEKHIRTAEQLKKCFQCYGDGKLSDHCWAQGWTEYKSTIRHFWSMHLNDWCCNFCETNLLHEMHLRNHAVAVHCLITW